MANPAEDSAAKFIDTFPVLGKFLDSWVDKIKDRCLSDRQRRAAWYIWGRYSLSIQTLRVICHPHYLPDLWHIGRSCLEHGAALRGAMADARLAEDYLAFEDKAKAYLAKTYERLRDSAESEKIDSLMKAALGDQWRDQAAFKWCEISKLVEEYGGPEERLLYAHWSHFTHCSIVGALVLERIGPTERSLDMAIATVYGGYVLSTSDFLDFAWGQIITSESERCKGEFEAVMRSWA